MIKAIYEVEKDGSVIARRNSLTWVRLAAPGVYLVCGEEDGEGVLVDGEIYHVRGCALLPGKETVSLDYHEIKEKRYSNMKENSMKAVIALTLAGAMTYLRELAVPVIMLAVVMAVDYASGLVRAWVKNELSSRVGIVGIVKKICYLLGVMVAIVADWVIADAGAKLGVSFGDFYFFGLLVTIWLILNECISILENIAEIGVPLPPFLLKLIQKLKKTVEDTGDKETE